MKNLHKLLFLLLLCAIKSVLADNVHPVIGWIISQEMDSLTGFCEVKFRMKFNASVVLLGTPRIISSYPFTQLSSSNLNEQTFAEGNAISLAISLQYPVNQLPFYPIDIEVQQDYREILVPNNPVSYLSAKGKVYFTPHNTVEVWSAGDFSNIRRLWWYPASRLDTTRIYIPKDSIPISNLSEAEIVDTTWKENWTFVKIPGLAYGIPMKPMHPDSIAAYCEKYGGGEGDTVRSRGIFTGTIQGRLVTHQRNDNGEMVVIPLAGLRVELHEEDIYFPNSNHPLHIYQTFATGYTEEDGTFTLSYTQLQNFENNNIELHLQVKSKSKDEYPVSFKIKTKQVGFPFNVYQKYYFLGQFGHNISTQNIGDVIANEEEYKTVHWTRRCQQYVDANGGATSFVNKLAIIVHDSSVTASRFIPDGIGNSFPFTDPTIRLTPGDGDAENTPYHEFGHYFLWSIQDKNMLIPVGANANCGHAHSSESNPITAWNEGWAEAFDGIIDAAFWREDNEYAHYSRIKANPPRCEFRDSISTHINQIGLQSEYYFQLGVYDLWDGSDKDLPIILPDSSQFLAGSLTSLHGYEDYSPNTANNAMSNTVVPWHNRKDQVSYSFEQIITPILNHKLGISSPEDYFRFFIDEVVGTDCEKRAEIRGLLKESLLYWDLPAYTNHIRNTAISLDDIFYSQVHNYTGFLCVGTVSLPFSDNYKLSYSPDSMNEIQNISFPIPSIITPPRYPYIIDDLWLGNATNTSFPTTSCTLSINGNPNVSTLVNGYLETCAGADIELNNATLILGHLSGLTAEVVFNEGSIFKISSNGKLIIHNNSKVVITANAKLSIEQGAQIELLGNNAILEIQGNLDLKDNAIFTFTGDGFVRFANGNTISAGNNAEMKFMGSSPTDKVVEIADNAHISNYSLAKTTVQSGKCELGEHAFWDTGNGAVLFENGIFTALDSDKPYQTIYTNGQAPVIRDCAFSYGETGLTARNFMSLGAALGLENVEIHHCNIGLRDYDKGVSLTNVHFHHNFMGWKADYQAFNSTLLNSEIDHNTDAGLSYTGNTYFYVENPYIHHNRYGLDFIGAGNIMPACGSVTFNDETGIGAYQNAKVQLSGNQLYGPKVDMSNNQVSSLFLWGASAYLNEGKNNLSPATGGVALGVLSTSVGNNIPANQNHWNENIIPYGTSPVFGADYNLYKVVNGNAVPLNVIDNQPINYEACDGIIKKQLYIPVCATCEVISTTSFRDIRVDNALRQLAEDMYKYTNLQHVVQNYNLLNEILAYEYSEGNKAQDDILNIALDMMKQLFAEGIEKQLITYNITGEMGQSASKIFQRIDERIANSLDTPTVFYQKIDKAICYNMLQRPALALNLLNSMSTTSTEEADYKAYWTCFMELRNDMQNQNISPTAIMERLSACPAMLHPIESDSKMESKNKMATFSIYPNPASAETSIALFSPQENIATLTVYDIQGRKVQEIPAFTCREGTNLIRLSALTLSKGMYSVVIQLGSEVLSEKWMVE